MKHSIRALVIAMTLAVGSLISTPSWAPTTLEYLVLLVSFGNTGDTGNIVFALDHAGAVRGNQPDCTFAGTAEINFVEIAGSGDAEAEDPININLTTTQPIQIASYQYPGASVSSALAAIIRVGGYLPNDCGVVVHRSVSVGGLTVETATPFEIVPDGFTQTFPALSPARSKPFIVPLGVGQVLNAVLVSASRHGVASDPGDDDCRTEGTFTVTPLDNSQDSIEIPFVADPVAIVRDLTDATGNPVPSGSAPYFEIVVNVGASDLSGSQPGCDGIFTIDANFTDNTTGEHTAAVGNDVWAYGGGYAYIGSFQ